MLEYKNLNKYITSILQTKNDIFSDYMKESKIKPRPGILRLLKELKERLEYDLPQNLLGKIWQGKYRGQSQKWFIMKFIGKNNEINIKTENPEFLDWKWVEISKLPDVVVNFKVNIYKKLRLELESLKLN